MKLITLVFRFKHHSLILVILGTCIAFSSCSFMLEALKALHETETASEPNGNNACHQASNFICEIEQEVHRLVNQQRRAHGKTMLEHHYFVASVNRQWNQEQYNMGQFELNGLQKRISDAYMKKYQKYDIFISAGHGCTGTLDKQTQSSVSIAKKIVDVWMKKSDPKKNILSNNAAWQATGVFVKDNQYIATQFLGTYDK